MGAEVLIALLDSIVGIGEAWFDRSPTPSAQKLAELDSRLQNPQLIRQLLQEKKKIEAIKSYRQQTGASLREAKAGVEAIEAEQSLVERQRKIAAIREHVPELAAIWPLIKSGNKINAIKAYREQTGVTLKEAKEAVELLQQDALMEEWQLLESQRREEIQEEAGGKAEERLALVQRLARQGKKIEAIKYYREMTGVGLREAKAAVEQLEVAVEEKHYPEGARLIDPEVLQRLLQAGRKIEAIKYYRTTTGVDLREAKAAVEWVEASMRQGAGQ